MRTVATLTFLPGGKPQWIRSLAGRERPKSALCTGMRAAPLLSTKRLFARSDKLPLGLDAYANVFDMKSCPASPPYPADDPGVEGVKCTFLGVPVISSSSSSSHMVFVGQLLSTPDAPQSSQPPPPPLPVPQASPHPPPAPASAPQPPSSEPHAAVSPHPPAAGAGAGGSGFFADFPHPPKKPVCRLAFLSVAGGGGGGGADLACVNALLRRPDC